MADDSPRVISRRDLLRGAAVAGAAVATTASRALAPAEAAPAAEAFQAGAAAPTLGRVAYEQLAAAESDLLEGIASRLIPSDESGPGAAEAQAVRYIDRALGGALAGSREAYRAGLEAFDRYSRQSRGRAFLELSPADQDSVLTDVESGAATPPEGGFVDGSAAFFAMVKGHVWQGTFGDPYYGGNANLVGWELIGYPGVRTMVSAEDQRRLERGELRSSRRSAYDDGRFNKAVVRAGGQGDSGHGH